MTTPTPSLAEQRAIEQGLPVLAVTAFELLHVATGNPIITRALDGSEVLLRLPTADDVLTFQRDAAATLPAEVRPPLMSTARAAELAAPLRLP